MILKRAKTRRFFFFFKTFSSIFSTHLKTTQVFKDFEVEKFLFVCLLFVFFVKLTKNYTALNNESQTFPCAFVVLFCHLSLQYTFNIKLRGGAETNRERFADICNSR